MRANFRKRHRAILLSFLTATGGALDAYGLLALGHVFISALSGNTVLLGIAVAQQRYLAAVTSVMVFAGFLPGALLGTYMLRARERRFAWEHNVESILILEVASLLALFVLVSFGWPFAVAIAVAIDVEVALAAFAMGLQNTVGRGVNPLGITTTYVTGPLLRLARGAAGKSKRTPTPASAPEGAALSPRATFIAVWGAYFGGIVAEVLVLKLNRTLALAFPLLLVTEVTIAAPFLDVWRPVGTGPEESPGSGQGDAGEPTDPAPLPTPGGAGSDERVDADYPPAAPEARGTGAPPGPLAPPPSPGR